MEMGKRKRGSDEKTKTPMQMEGEYREALAAYNKLQREHQQYTTYYQQEAQKIQQTSSDCREIWFLENHVKPNLFLLEAEKKALQQRVQQQFQQLGLLQGEQGTRIGVTVGRRSTRDFAGNSMSNEVRNLMGTNQALELEIEPG